MSGALLSALDHEIEQLESKLSSNPDFAKYVEAKRLRALYTTPAVTMLTPARFYGGGRVAEPSPISGAGRKKSRSSPERQKILDATREYIKGSKNPTKTADIYGWLTLSGVDVPGEKPQNNLSAMLSNSDLFISHGRAGWTLAENEIAADGELSGSKPPAADHDGWPDQPAEPLAQGREAGPGGGT